MSHPEETQIIQAATVQAPPALLTREVWQATMAKRHNIGNSALSNVRDPFMITDLNPDQQADVSENLLYESDQSDPEIGAATKEVFELRMNHGISGPDDATARMTMPLSGQEY